MYYSTLSWLLLLQTQASKVKSLPRSLMSTAMIDQSLRHYIMLSMLWLLKLNSLQSDVVSIKLFTSPISRNFSLLWTPFMLLKEFLIHHLIHTNPNQLQFWENSESFSKEILTTPSNSGTALVITNSLSIKGLIKKPKN